MNKKVKSLLVAGLLVIGMNGMRVNVFAAEPLVSTITNPKLVDNKKIISLQGGSIIVEVTKTTEGYKFAPRWDSNKFKVTDVRAYYDDEIKTSIYNASYFVDSKCYPVEKDSNVYKSDVIDMKIAANLIKVEVVFVPVDKDNNGKPDFKDDKPVTPDQSVDDPNTGDTSIMPMVATAIVSAAGLFVLNKKDDEE